MTPSNENEILPVLKDAVLQSKVGVNISTRGPQYSSFSLITMVCYLRNMTVARLILDRF